MKKLKNKKSILVALIAVVILLIIAYVAKKTYAIDNMGTAEWYKDYTYTLNDTDKTITLTKFNGSSDTVVVSKSATIDGTEYNVIISGGVYKGNSIIKSVEFENGVKAENSLAGLFYNTSNLIEIKFNNFDTSNTTDMHDMFRSCKVLETLDLSNINTSNVTNMNSFFRNSTKLKSLDLSNFNTSKVTDMGSMFRGSSGLQSLDISSFDTTNVLNMEAFNSVNSLKKIKIGSKTDFKIGASNGHGGSFGRGTWLKEEDNKKYSAIDIVTNSGTKDMSGTYTKISNVTEDMNIDFNIDYKINKISKIDEFSTTNSDILYENDKRYIVLNNLTIPDTDDLTIHGDTKFLFKDVVTDSNNKKYDLQMIINNIHLYDLNYDDGVSNFYGKLNILNSRGLYFEIEIYKTMEELENSNNYIYRKSPASFDTTLEILNKDGNKVNGNYLFSAYDIDVPSVKDINSKYKIYDGTSGYGQYSEGVSLLEGFDMNTLKFSHDTLLTLNGNRITGTCHDNDSELSEFVIKANANKTKFNWTSPPNAQTEFMTYYQPKLVEIEKIDAIDNSLLNNAKLQLFYGENKKDEWTTDQNSKKLFLYPGKYTLKEISAPTNYEISKDLDFYVDINDTLSMDGENVSKITMKDERKKYQYKINYIDKNTNEIIDTVNEEGLYNTAIEGKNHKKNIENYIYDSMDKESITIKNNVNENVINIYYIKVSGGVIEKHIDSSTNEVLYNEAHKGNVGDQYSTSPKEFDSYLLDEKKLPNNATGTMIDDPIEVIYYYNKLSNVTVKYIDSTTGKELAENTIINGYEGKEYQTNPKEIKGYLVSGNTGNINGTMTADPIEVIYYYDIDDTPQTGDESTVVLWIVLMTISVAIVCMIINSIKKKMKK